MVDESGRAIILETTGSAPINQERNIFIEMMRRIHADVIATIPTRIKTGTALIKYLTETKLGGNRYELEIKYNCEECLISSLPNNKKTLNTLSAPAPWLKENQKLSLNRLTFQN